MADTFWVCCGGRAWEGAVSSAGPRGHLPWLPLWCRPLTAGVREAVWELGAEQGSQRGEASGTVCWGSPCPLPASQALRAGRTGTAATERDVSRLFSLTVREQSQDPGEGFSWECHRGPPREGTSALSLAEPEHMESSLSEPCLPTDPVWAPSPGASVSA